MALETVEARQSRLNDRDTIEELGSHIQRLGALLRAANNCGANDRDDEAWLVSIAHAEAEAAEACYDAWASPAEQAR